MSGPFVWKRPRAGQVHIKGVGKLIVVGSGKGGVGKSTVSVNLAIALAAAGAAVGLLDADAYGPSIPMMLGVRKRSESEGWQAILPLGYAGPLTAVRRLPALARYGVKVMSVGFFIGEEQAVAPMPDVLGLLIRQLLTMVDWGKLDYLIVDLPPGTGEPQATLCRELALDGALLVTTPQEIARMDTAKALAMFQQAHTPVLGLVENMSGFVCPHCGERVEIFPPSQRYDSLLGALPLLATIPLDPATAASGDHGQPVTVSRPDSAVAAAFRELAERVRERLAGAADSDARPDDASNDTSDA
jgi:ATP-binding protein involved in chromosome partitioning